MRRLLQLLLNVWPDRLIFAINQELESKRCRYQKSLLKEHGADLYLASPVVIISPSEVAFGKECAVNEFVHILAGGGVTIGNGVWIANHASLITVTHPTDVEFIGDHPHTTAPIVIEDYVWIGSHATIMPGVTLGRSCVVGAGSVVTKDVPAYAIVAGVPAKVLRYKSIRSEGSQAGMTGLSNSR